MTPSLWKGARPGEDFTMGSSTGLGIDVGGTNTDAVLVDLKERKILSVAKVPTTQEDLARGIKNVLTRLDQILFPKVSLISLSTTLATNSVVEGARRKVRGFLIGYGPELCPDRFRDEVFLISGGHNVLGDEKSPLDLNRVRTVLEKTKNEIEAYAVCGYFSVRNPDHELQVKHLIHELTGKPVVCGHEISLQLDAVKRATTTLLNGHLIPIIHNLIDSVRRAFKEHHLVAPLMIVKGDGSLMSESVIKDRPIETILSGPAASVMGAKYLLGLSGEIQNAMIVDIGGTTTDIAQVKGGTPKLNPEGAKVGNWQTNVTAIDIRTIGLGGDSQIDLDDQGKLKVGPQRIIPLSYLGSRHPGIKEELARIQEHRSLFPHVYRPDFWVRLRPGPSSDLPYAAREILPFLSEGPVSLFQLVHLTNKSPGEVLTGLSILERWNVVQQSGLTPTDILHVTGIFEAWDKESAERALRIFCERSRLEVPTFLHNLGEAMDRLMGAHIVELLLPPSVRDLDGCNFYNLFLDQCFHDNHKIDSLRFSLSLKNKIIGIGAPAHAFLPSVAEKLGTQAVIPFYAGVANAIGAITSAILVTEEVLIRPSRGRFRVYSAAGTMFFPTLAAATDQSKKTLHDLAFQKAKNAGADQVEVLIEEKEDWVPITGGDTVFIEKRIIARAMGNPRQFSEDLPEREPS
jgi:N-methylhydantoinase A/oxoprolinase/acetone carboxylase beta subunit